MTSLSSAVSTEIAAYPVPCERSGEPLRRASQEKAVTRLARRSLSAQMADHGLLYLPKKIGLRVLTGLFPRPEFGRKIPRPFVGTCDTLMGIINDTVQHTLEGLDYNGLKSFLQLFHQLDEGKSFGEITIDSRGEEQGSACVGISHAILKSLREKHGIEGSLAALTADSFDTVDHGAVIVECSDGFVLIESTDGFAPISVPFGQIRECNGYLITASQPGSTVPLTIRPVTKDTRAPTLHFCINIANADDLVMKHYIMGCLWRKNSIQIGIFDPDRRRRKFVLLCPSESKIVFKDTTTIGEQRTKEFAFSEALRPEWRQKLHDFMQPQYCRSVPGFQTPPDTLHRQIVEFVSQADRVKRLFDQTDLDETM